MAGSNRPGEFELIRTYFRPLAAAAPGAFDLVDDAAVFVPRPAELTVVTADAIAAGIHFFPDDPPAAIAAKALRVNLSDLAAKGAEPRAYLLVLALAEDWTEAWVREFAKGLLTDQTTYGITLIGGDTMRAAGGTTIAITALGGLPGDAMVRRGKAEPGDIVFVSGTVGDAALGLSLRLRQAKGETVAARFEPLLRRYLYPEPRVALAAALRRCARAAMDVSDGLMGDFAKLCAASGVSGAIESVAVPLSEAARALVAAEPAHLSTVLTGGDDYEILAAIPPEAAEDFRQQAAKSSVAVTAIGRIVAGTGLPGALDANGAVLPLASLSFDHFRAR